MENKIKELECLGAKVKLNKDGLLTLDGNWNEKYNDYHELFSEIDGFLYTNSVEQDKDFLKDLKSSFQIK